MEGSPRKVMEKLTELYQKGRPGMYQQQVDDLENNNYSSNNNNMSDNNNGEISILSSGHPGIKLWQTISKNIMGINCLYNHAQKRYVVVRVFYR